uniref:ribonuclease H family protein n=1 Tax=Proteus mirabilis TaxID=584 RepID=UPI0015C534E3
EQAFQELKDRLTSAPILIVPSSDETYTVYMDASRIGLGFVLMQQSCVVAYVFRQPKLHEKNHLFSNWKLATVILALRYWRCYLYEDEHKA